MKPGTPHGEGTVENPGEKEQALAEEREAQVAASEKRRRPQVLIEGVDVTEQVVSVVESLGGSMDWGSGFLDATQTAAAEDLMKRLKFECREDSYSKRFGGRYCDLVFGHDGKHHYVPYRKETK